MNKETIFNNIKRVGILPVVCPSNQFQLDTLLDAIKNTEIKVLEITLRNEFSTNAIKYIKSKHPELFVGAGTVNTPSKLEEAVACAPRFSRLTGLCGICAWKSDSAKYSVYPRSVDPLRNFKIDKSRI